MKVYQNYKLGHVSKVAKIKMLKSQKMKNYYMNIFRRREQSQRIARSWENSEIKNRRIAGLKKSWAENQTRKKIASERLKKLWQNGNIRNSIVRKRKLDKLKRIKNHPIFIEFNKKERICRCGCNSRIQWRDYYRWRGIPQYVRGHGDRQVRSLASKRNWNIFNIRMKYLNSHKGMLGKRHTKESKEKIKAARAKQKIPRQDTIPELILFGMLKKLNLRFETHKVVKEIIPFHQFDVVISDEQKVIEVDGCYWHGCQDLNCRWGKKQLFLSEFQKKSIERDNFINELVNRSGWRILRFWEHDLRENSTKCYKLLHKFLKNEKKYSCMEKVC